MFVCCGDLEFLAFQPFTESDEPSLFNAASSFKSIRLSKLLSSDGNSMRSSNEDVCGLVCDPDG